MVGVHDHRTYRGAGRCAAVCEISDVVLNGALSVLLQTECIEAVVLSGAGRCAASS